jgi:catechol 2,3-dioxygenase-like lactoylglutathione lyase family enzyme
VTGAGRGGEVVVQVRDRTSATVEAPVKLRLQGVDHLALVTDDMKKTIEFYTEVLGFTLVHVRRIPYAPDRGQPPYDNCRHYFFDMGNQSLLAFFEYPKDAPRGNRDALGGMQHVAFHADRATFERAQTALRAGGVDFVGPFHLGGRFYSIYFFDPNRIRLEITTDVTQPDYDVITSVYQTEAEAREELESLYDSPEEVRRILEKMPLTDR